MGTAARPPGRRRFLEPVRDRPARRERKAVETLVTDTVVARTSGTRYAVAGRATVGGRIVRLHRVLP